MDGTFVREFRDTLTEPVDLTGRVFVPAGWTEVHRRITAPVPIGVGTLTAVAQYLLGGVDGVDLTRTIVHVESPTQVSVKAFLEASEVEFRRQVLLVATLNMVGFPLLGFGQYMDAESFFIGLQVGFVPTESRDALLRLVAGIRDSNVRETVDDKVSQRVTTSVGVAFMKDTEVPNPVALQPWRTFREVEQPESKFVLRMRSASKEGEKPAIALFEAEGAFWKIEAITRIATYLRTLLPENVTILA